MPRSPRAARTVSICSTFTTSIEARPPPITMRPSADLVVRAVIPGLREVVEPVNERVLVDQAAADVRVGAVDRQRPVAPGAVRQEHGGEAPVAHQVAEVDVASDLRARQEVAPRRGRGWRRWCRIPCGAASRASAAGRPRSCRRGGRSARRRPRRRRARRARPRLGAGGRAADDGHDVLRIHRRRSIAEAPGMKQRARGPGNAPAEKESPLVRPRSAE